MPQSQSGPPGAHGVRTEERRPLPYAWSEVRARLQRELPRLLPALGIKDPIRGSVVQPLNPRRNDRRPGSFVIWTAPVEAAGAWRDYQTDDHGDVLDLVLYLLGLNRRIDAYWWALDFLGLARGRVRSASADRLERERSNRDRKAAQARAEAAAERQAGKLWNTWKGLRPISGTLAEVYLQEARGIDLGRLSKLPWALRFSPRVEHMDPASGELTAWPCMVAAMTLRDRVPALHRTWLALDGSGKAPVANPKKMIGRARGTAIQLSRGASGLPATEAAKRGQVGPLILGEGIETTLTCAVARPDYRAWAAGSLSLMGVMEWPLCASGVILLRDNDWGKPEAVRAFERVEAHWRGQADGRPVKVVASAVGSDFNDWARA